MSNNLVKLGLPFDPSGPMVYVYLSSFSLLKNDKHQN
jgi:hypothetical protein